ncbi:LytR/AlgR family response regulator transcription factor [Paenibacillus planticolens]|uniref:Response regulator n=1 Tax=Paenibacillus planticolens TaxID=2654976 RepID=A0ABX1ZZL8_9BACL|nr:LytTR family transcriptional regulator DNA-binding domain-containing protein [Paenibacillus planticolens]NOV04173.1 response regulator [Paenibacillus planticolens]
MGWNIVIADDEEPAREELIYLLESHAEVDKVTAASGGMDAIKKVKELAPDVLFLDMDMPDLNGLQVAEIVGEINPQVKIVFSTAYDQYAVHAFKLRAFHYMLKPYDEEDIVMVFRELRKIQPRSGAAPASGSHIPSVKTSVKLALELDEGIIYVSPKDIIYISKEVKHVQVHLYDKAYIVSYTLSELEHKLEPYGFFRCHKSYLVNLASISEMKTWVNGAYNLLMEDAGRCTIPVSRNYVKMLRLKLEI